jgi:enterochelin esterase family protein
MRRGRVEIVAHESRLLADNPLGDPATRDIAVYLPPSYDADAKRRFPTVLVLPGFTGTGLGLLNRGAWQTPLDRRMDALVESGRAKEAILVLPDCLTRYGGSQYVDSPAMGRYQSYLVDELIPFVDARWRTIPAREARAVVGKSSGGYGALTLAIERPELFAAAGSHAGDAAFLLSYGRELGKIQNAIERRGGVRQLLAWFDAQQAKPGSMIDVMNFLACAAAWSPNPEGPYGYGEGFALPFDLRTGELRDDVWARWLARDPVRLVEKPAVQEALRGFAALFIDAGTSDEYSLQLGARQIADRLRAAGIAHVHEEFDGGHMNTAYRYDRSLEVLTRALVS